MHGRQFDRRDDWLHVERDADTLVRKFLGLLTTFFYSSSSHSHRCFYSSAIFNSGHLTTSDHRTTNFKITSRSTKKLYWSDIRGEQEIATVPGCPSIVQRLPRTFTHTVQSHATYPFHSPCTPLSHPLLICSLSPIRYNSFSNLCAPGDQSAPTFPPSCPF